ncbi:MAG TPA: hypothetical protein VG722_01725 [Tepidisphaeraceae bacterium]|nr:hypothetical protein [Tepidisphaeraceae bacterium]
MTTNVFITVAEPSADQHASFLVQSLRKLRPTLKFEGIGGEKMRQAGVTIHHESASRAAMGWRAALRAREVSRWLRWTDDYYREHKPALHICCDSWSMNWRFARLARHHGVPVLYYIAPQTWASREGRIKKIRQYVDKLACILPFEEQYFRNHGIDATFVGHPLFDELQRMRNDECKMQNVNPSFEPDSATSAPTIGILPGSRRGIAAHNYPHQLDVARQIREVFPEARFRVPTTSATHATVTRLSSDFPGLEIQPDNFDSAVPACDFCITVSGTAALHVAAFGIPFVVVYRVNPWHWHLVGRWVVKTRTYSLVNILSGRPEKIVPEFIPWYGSNKEVADRVIDYLQHPEKMTEQQRQLAEVLRSIDRPGASMNVARMALEMLPK